MWWAKVFASLYILFDLTTIYCASYNQHQHRHGHSCQQQCVARRGPPFCKEWCLVYYFDGCRYRPQYECCKYKEKPGYCPPDPRWCSSPFSYHSTRIYECHHDFGCPVGYKCCKDSCYVHTVCKPCANVAPVPGTTPGGITRDTEETTVRSPPPTRPPVTTTSEKTTTIETTTTTEAATTTTEATTTTTTTEATTTEATTTTTTEATTTTQAKTTTTTEATTTTTTEKPTTHAPTTLMTTTTTQEEVTTLSTTTTESYDDYDEDYSDYDNYDIPDPESARRKLK